MKWIVFSDSRPAQLHALLESAQLFMPRVHPVVLVNRVDACEDAYGIVESRFTATMLITDCHSIQTITQHLISSSDQTGKVDGMTLLTTDTMLFTRKVDLRNASGALMDNNTLGLSLMLSPLESWTPTEPRHFKGAPHGLHTWLWPNQQNEWGRAFDFGTVYRTSDLMGPIYRTEWHSPESLRNALHNDASLRVKNRMACMNQSSLVECRPLREASTLQYVNGEVIDIESLRHDQSRFHWKPYGGQ